MAPIGGLLWRSLRVHQLWGANTDVGKTVFTTILSAAVRHGKSGTGWRDNFTYYLKPVSTGPIEENDQNHFVKFFRKTASNRVTRNLAHRILYQYEKPISPDIAAAQSPQGAVSDSELVKAVALYIFRASANPGWLFCETAGGVHSPGPSGTSQADLYRPLRLPALLIGDSKLGGISQTIAAFESLRLRGYDVEAVMLFENAEYRNHEYLTTYFEKFGIPVVTVNEPPPRHDDSDKDYNRLTNYYDGMARSHKIKDFLKYLDDRHEQRMKSLEGMSAEAHKTIWYPFTQQKLLPPEGITAIDSAYGDHFQTFSAVPPQLTPKDSSYLDPGNDGNDESTYDELRTDGPNYDELSADELNGLATNRDEFEMEDLEERDEGGLELEPAHDPSRKIRGWWRSPEQRTVIPQPKPSHLRASFDGSASWWTQGLGHANPQLTLAAAYAAGRYGHVMFAEAVHQPALQLAQMLLKGSNNPRLSRVFYSDNGSTGTEVAVKMALRAARLRYGWGPREDLGILGLQGSYHGDTMGAMDCSEPGTYNEKIEWYRGKGFWFDFPTVQMVKGKWTVTLPEELLAEQSAKPIITFDSLEGLFDVENRHASQLRKNYDTFIKTKLEALQKEGRKFGALMLEPVVLGAGGMLLADPLFQRSLVQVVRRSPHLFATADSPESSREKVHDPREWAGLPVVFDEVFTGLYRLGRFTAAELLQVKPDISVHAKLLTGGLIPLATTLASESIFNAFSSDDKSDALLHGHSYTAHAVGCQVAIESVSTLEKMERENKWAAFQEEWETEDERNEKQAALPPRPLPKTGKEAGKKADKAKESKGMNHKVKLQEERELKEWEATVAAVIAAAAPSVWSVWSHDFVERLSMRKDHVKGVWALGSVLAIQVKGDDADGSSGYKSTAARTLQAELLAGGYIGAPEKTGSRRARAKIEPFLEPEKTNRGGRRRGGKDHPRPNRSLLVDVVSNVHSRVLGDVLYLMASQASGVDAIRALETWLLAVRALGAADNASQAAAYAAAARQKAQRRRERELEEERRRSEFEREGEMEGEEGRKGE